MSFEDLLFSDKMDLLKVELKKSSSLIRNFNTDKRNKLTNSRYPSHSGYCVYVERPVRDSLKWMNIVEEVLDLLIEEIREGSS